MIPGSLEDCQKDVACTNELDSLISDMVLTFMRLCFDSC